MLGIGIKIFYGGLCVIPVKRAHREKGRDLDRYFKVQRMGGKLPVVGIIAVIGPDNNIIA